MTGARAALPTAFLKTLWHARKLRTRSAIEAHQQAGVRRLIEHARGTSFYASFGHARLTDLPIVDKAMMLERFDAFNTQGLDAATAWRIIASDDTMPGYEVGCSTGTSGTRGLYIVSAAERFRWLGTILAKLLPDVATARHRVAIILPGPSPLYQAANESRLLRLAHFDARHGLERIIGDVEAFAPTVLLGAPKTLRGLAMAGARLRPRKIFAAAEVLDPADKAIAEHAFGVLVGQVYMATEGLFGTSCRHGHLHLAEDIVAFELEPVVGDPTLVAPLMSDFTRRTQIMARYRLGDLLRLVDGDCACGSAMRRVRVIGRHGDLVMAPALNGRACVALAPDTMRDAVVGSAPDIDDYRIGLTGDGKILSLLLPHSVGPETLEIARTALDRWRLVCGADLSVGAALADLAVPFGRKLRRIAPVPPETL